MSHFLYNKLYVLQSLTNNDQKTGEELVNRINAFSIRKGRGTGTEVNPNCWTVKQSLRIREPACIGQVTYH